MNSRNKGAAGERELAKFLREHGYDAKRGQQRSGLEESDVVGGPDGWHLECKRVENLNFWKAFEQAERDADEGDLPMVCARRNRSEWLALVRLDTMVRLLRMVELLYPGYLKHLQ